ncbi:MAG: hypothetical protein U0791_24270 [Gemmataceae bacterium]
MPEENIDPAKCPKCAGRMKVLKTRLGASGVTTRYRRCSECGVKTADKARVVETPIGKPRLIAAPVSRLTHTCPD